MLQGSKDTRLCPSSFNYAALIEKLLTFPQNDAGRRFNSPDSERGQSEHSALSLSLRANFETPNGRVLPVRRVDKLFQRAGVADEFVEQTDDLVKLGAAAAFPLPAVHHQVVQRLGAVHGTWQPVALLHRLYYLHTGRQNAMTYLQGILTPCDTV